MSISAQQPLPIMPGAQVDIGWDWTDWLPAGVTITGTPVVGLPAELTRVGDVRTNGAVVSVTVQLAEDAPLGPELVATCQIEDTAIPPRRPKRGYRLRVALVTS